MNEVVSKLSSYNIFNYLVPGAAFCLLVQERGLMHLDHVDVAGRLVIFYVVGMTISRAGSLLIDPLLKRARLIPRSNYAEYVRASSRDAKVAILLETSNTYRTMTGACISATVASVLGVVVPRSWITHDATACAILAAVSVLFAVAYIKQNKAVTRRVRAAAAIEDTERAPPAIRLVAE